MDKEMAIKMWLIWKELGILKRIKRWKEVGVIRVRIDKSKMKLRQGIDLERVRNFEKNERMNEYLDQLLKRKNSVK